MYNGYRSDRQWSELQGLERRPSIDSVLSFPPAGVQSFGGGRGLPTINNPDCDVAEVTELDRITNGSRQAKDHVPSNRRSTTSGSRNVPVSDGGHRHTSSQPRMVSNQSDIRRDTGVELRRTTVAPRTEYPAPRRTRSEIYPTIANVDDASCLAPVPGCCSDCLVDELATGRRRSNGPKLTIAGGRGVYDRPVNGYVVVGQAPLTMTAVAEATPQGRQPVLSESWMAADAVDRLSNSAPKLDDDGVLRRRLQPPPSGVQRRSHHDRDPPSNGFTLGTGSSHWHGSGPVEPRRRLRSGDEGCSADCQPLSQQQQQQSRAPRQTSTSSVDVWTADNISPAVLRGDNKSSISNGVPRFEANYLRANGGSAAIVSPIEHRQVTHNTFRVEPSVALEPAFDDFRHDCRSYPSLGTDYRSRSSRDVGLSTGSTVSGRPTSHDVEGSSVRFGVSAGDRSPLRPALPTASALRHIVERQRQAGKRRGSISDDFGFVVDQTSADGLEGNAPHNGTTSKVAPSLEAHSLSLTYTPSNVAVADPTGNHFGHRQQSVSSASSSSSSAPSSSGLQLRRRLKTIVESLDGLTAGGRKSMLSSLAAPVTGGGRGNTRRTRIKLQRSSSDPEGIDRIGRSSANNDDAEFGFGGNVVSNLRRLPDDCAMNRFTINVLPPSPSTTMSSGSHSADEPTSIKGSNVGKSSKSSMSIKLWSSKKAPSNGVGRNSEPCSPLNSSMMFDRDGCDVTSRNAQIRTPPSSLLDLTDEERCVLQKISLSKLNASEALNGCSIVIPKGGASGASGGRVFSSKFSQLKKYVSTSSAFSDISKQTLDSTSGKDKSTGGGKGLVFGVSLDKVLVNEAEVCSSSSSSSTFVDLKSSSSDDNLIDALSLSLTESLSARCRSTSSLNSLSNHHATSGQQQQQQQQSMVPYIVRACCQFLQLHGRHVPGIFRVTGAKSRVTMLRHEFDSGRHVQLTEEHHVVHDVASLLKEFIRDLPDPLLTRDLYTAFLATTAIDDVNRRVAVLRLLVSLLPPANRDTLWTLLSFLGVLAKYSDDTVDDMGQQLPGNKMDSANLATVFGPNLLNKSRTGKLHVDGLEQMSHNAEIVAVTKDLIDFHSAIYRLTKELYNDILDSKMTRHPNHVTSSSQSHSSHTPPSSVQQDAKVTSKIYPLDVALANVTMTTNNNAASDSAHSLPDAKSLSETDYSSRDRRSMLPLGDIEYSPRHSVAGSDRTSSSSSSFSASITGHHPVPHHVHRAPSPATSTTSAGSVVTSERVSSSHGANGDVTRPAVGDWQMQRWRHWEQLADQSKRQASEQQTLV